MELLNITQMSFLPEPYKHPYSLNPSFNKGVVYFSSEFAIDQTLKIYSGGLGFLAGSHMRSAYDLQQNMAGIGILWSYGYYNQVRGEDREMAVQLRRKNYHFLKDTQLEFEITVHDSPVKVKAYYLAPEIFGTCPMFFLTTDIEGNDEPSRNISCRLYDSDPHCRVAQYMLLGKGGMRLLEELKVEPAVYHLNEAHALPAAFHYYQKMQSLDAVKEKFVFTTHTPEQAGNEVHSFELLKNFSFFSGIKEEKVREITGIEDDQFSHTLAGLRLSGRANGVSKLHGEVAGEMWGHYDGICPITHVTNAQNKKYWVDGDLEAARIKQDFTCLSQRKRNLKERLFDTVADQTGKLFEPDVMTLVWARRFAEYKRADLITRDLERFEALLSDKSRPIQIIWAGKPYPKDYGAIDIFNQLIRLSSRYSNAAVLVGYELALSKKLKEGSDLWLNNPVVTREASGTSGMTAAMNGSVNLSTYDGWICEFAKDRENAFIVPPADRDLTPEARDIHDREGIFHILETQALPLYYNEPRQWQKIVMNSMNDVVPFFDSDRMATQYYENIYPA